MTYVLLKEPNLLLMKHGWDVVGYLKTFKTPEEARQYEEGREVAVIELIGERMRITKLDGTPFRCT